MAVSKFIATFFGIGFIGKGAGTVAALVTCVLVYFAVHSGMGATELLLVSSAVSFIAGAYTASVVEKSWGKDNKRVVIDEVLGMCVSLLFLPINFFTLGASFVLFRFFDIAKPLWIRRLERLNGGWGVMADDLLAGIYANISVRLILFIMTGYYEKFL